MHHDEVVWCSLECLPTLCYDLVRDRVNIRPKKVMIASCDLCNTCLYKNEQIVINKEWKKHFDQNKQNHENIDTPSDQLDSPYSNDNLESIIETLVHDYSDAHVIHDLDTRIILIAPSEGFHPLGIFKDKIYEEINFPTLFYGSSRPIDVVNHISYQTNCSMGAIAHVWWLLNPYYKHIL